MDIALTPVKSSQIAAIGYDEGSKTLAIKFKAGSGGLYHYSNVSKEQHAALINAPSIGSHFIKNIKPRKDLFPFKKIEDSAARKA